MIKIVKVIKIDEDDKDDKISIRMMKIKRSIDKNC